ncbi:MULTISPECIES: LEA type 2 family protein [Gammaproteobacteria]|uniref:NDR1/HIN1-like protein n=1 Tax=Gammaproteobacteria TaxID=1236 RepID=UPI000DD0B3C4|nr:MULTISPECIES: LEA type 2 family protein [Gammaproteobacteria]RTE87229.1 hypothetical protein DQX04_02240 [Aliidiomarina sp. B3213]TCZ92983.1 hypothetical protein EYQ95_03065 [Lysobacter sp. N42]
MRKFSKLVIATCSALILSATIGCSAIKENIKEQVTYKIRSVDAQITTREGAFGIPAPAMDIEIAVEILNDSPINITLNQIDYTVYLQDNQVTTGSSNETIEIPADGGTNVIRFTSHLSTSDLINSGLSVARNRGLPPVRVEGIGIIETRFGTHEVPFTLNYNEQDESA